MAFDEALGDRVRELLDMREGVTERRMFGGLAFMVGGNMACGVMGGDLIVRVPRDDMDRVLAEPDTRPFDFTGKPMKGFVVVGSGRLEADDELAVWIDAGADHAASLPAKG